MERNEGSPSVNTVRSCGTPRTHAGNYMGNCQISRKNMDVMAGCCKLGARILKSNKLTLRHKYKLFKSP